MLASVTQYGVDVCGGYAEQDEGLAEGLAIQKPA